VLPEEVNLDDAGCVDKLIGWASKENLGPTIEWIRNSFIPQPSRPFRPLERQPA